MAEGKGKQHKHRLKTTDLAEAKRKLRDYRAEVEVTTPGAGKVTVREVCPKYLQTVQDQTKSTRVNQEIILLLEKWMTSVSFDRPYVTDALRENLTYQFGLSEQMPFNGVIDWKSPMKPLFNWKIFACELAVYAALVLSYFLIVLHFLADWLKELFDHDRRTFAVVALLLMIGQAVGLEVISSLLFGLIRTEKK